jgi:hypothetical protein
MLGQLRPNYKCDEVWILNYSSPLYMEVKPTNNSQHASKQFKPDVQSTWKQTCGHSLTSLDILSHVGVPPWLKSAACWTWPCAMSTVQVEVHALSHRCPCDPLPWPLSPSPGDHWSSWHAFHIFWNSACPLLLCLSGLFTKHRCFEIHVICCPYDVHSCTSLLSLLSDRSDFAYPFTCGWLWIFPVF